MKEWIDRRYCFAWTFVVIALAYLIMFAVLPKDSIWISDEGNRIMSVQAYSLNGEKALPDPLAGIVNIPSGIRAYPLPYFIRKNGQWRSAYQLFFPWVTSGVYSVLGRTAAWFLAVIGGLLTVLGAGLLARNLFADDLKASLVMAMCAFCTPVWFYSGTFLETTCASAFAVFALWLFMEFRKSAQHEFWKFFVCGMLTGISILFREEGFVFAAGFGLALMIWFFSWKRLSGYVCGAAAVVIPLLIYNYCDSGSIFGMHHVVYTHLSKAPGSFLINQLKNYSFYLFLLCLPFWGQLNLVIPWILLAGPVLRQVPKLDKVVECFYLSVAVVSCGAGLWCNIMTPHGGVFIFQSLLDHVPLFALFLLCLVPLFRSESREIRFLTLVALAAIFLPPALLNHAQPGMFWGGRHFLNIVPVLCILSVYLLLQSDKVSRVVKNGGWLLVILSFAANVSGYGILSTKRNFSAQYVREMAKPEYQVILTDMYWMPEELAWIHREKCVLLMLNGSSLDQVRPFLRANGIKKFHLLLGRNYRKITNESIQRTIDETEFKPGPHFSHPQLGFFECQLFECTFKK